MKQILGAAFVCIVGFGLFGGFIWVSVFATDYAQTVTNPIVRLTITLLMWSLGVLILATVLYIIYLVYRLYTDPNMPLSDMRKLKNKVPNPEFE